MNKVEQGRNYTAFITLAISCFVVLMSFIWQGNRGFSLWDEGFLWYGVQRVLQGEVPILDFMAYDPGRYYWSAALLGLFGDSSIVSLRAAVAIIQVLGLFVGLLLIAQSNKSKARHDIFFWLLSAAILFSWMFPRHKLFDVSISIFLLGVLTYLISNPLPKRYFITGTCIGLIAVFGRNHGVYGAIASLGVITWLNINNSSSQSLFKIVVLWGFGVIIGFLPIIIMTLLIPGFASAFYESILFLFEMNSTNIPLPIPWPWTVKFADSSAGEVIRGMLIGICFIGILVFAALSVIWVVYRKVSNEPVHPTLVASAFLAFPYAHYAYSRADVSHLAQGIFPSLIGCLILLSTAQSRIKRPVSVTLCIASVWITHVFHPGIQCKPGNQCINVEISGKEILTPSSTARDITMLRELTEQFASNGESIFVTPFWPGAYALLERRSPIWEIYALFNRTEEFQKNEIERIKASKPGFVLVIDLPLDGREELRYKNTHSLTHEYIHNNFQPVTGTHNSTYQIFIADGKEH